MANKKDDLSYSDLINVLANRMQEISIIFIVALTLFLLVALGSYNYLDPAWSHTGIVTKSEVSNAAGITGAYISDIFLSVFGYLGYFVPVVVAAVFATFYKGLNFKTYAMIFLLKSIGGILTLFSGCGLINFYVPVIGKIIPNNSGGIVGGFVQLYSSQWVGKEGAAIVLTALLMVGLSLTLNLSWSQIAIRLNKTILWITNKIKLIAKWFGKLFLQMVRFNKIKSKFVDLYRKIKSNISKFIYNFKLVINNKIINSLKFSKFKPNISNNTVRQRHNIDNVVMQDNRLANPISSNDNINEVALEAQNLGNKTIANTRVICSENLHTSDNQTNVNKSQQKGLPIRKAHQNNNVLPEVELLEVAKNDKSDKYFSKSVLDSLSNTLEQKLAEFGAGVKVVAVYPGPVITRFELSLQAGLKVSKISALAKDLARSLSVSSVRVVEVIPGKSVIGLEIPNEHREVVRLREIVESSEYQNSKSPVTLALGKDIAGQPLIADLAKMPHLLVAGTTGSGKSVGVNAMLLSMLYKSTPEDLRLILIDPKMLELSIYEGIPHLLAPVVTDMKDAANALRWCVNEMERRYQLMAALGVRNLAGFNAKVGPSARDGAPIVDPLWTPNDIEEPPLLTTLPRVVVIIDEFADMMMIVGKKVEELIARIAQKARAAGIHMILATQRPSVDVITGLIKANIPTRMAFQVSSKIDSRTVLDQQGAEQLLGHGDMLFLPPGRGIPTRVHGAFVSDQEVHDVVASLKRQGAANYEAGIRISGNGLPDLNSSFSDGFEDEDYEQDELFAQAVEIVTESKKTSVSNLQRRLKIGYNRAARLVEDMEAKGILSPIQPNGLRELLVDK